MFSRSMSGWYLGEVADALSPKIFEITSGLGGRACKLLEFHPIAQVTATDIDPTFVAPVFISEACNHRRANVREMDATAIGAPDGYRDLAPVALSFDHLPLAPAAQYPQRWAGRRTICQSSTVARRGHCSTWLNWRRRWMLCLPV